MTGRDATQGWTPAVIAVIAIWLVACAAGPQPDDRPVSVAVWDLEDLSAGREQPAMGQMLAGQVAAHFSGNRDYQVIERQHLQKVLEELQLGGSDLADARTRLRLGRIIGARQMVFGAYHVIGRTLRLDLRLVDVASGKIINTATATADGLDMEQWLQAAERAARELVR